MTEGNAAAIPDSDSGGAVGADGAADGANSAVGADGAIGADGAVDAVVGTASDGDAGVVSTYY